MIMGKQRLSVKFRIDDFNYWVWADRISDVKDGFWINEVYQITKAGDCKYYILPHQIIKIEKVMVDK